MEYNAENEIENNSKLWAEEMYQLGKNKTGREGKCNCIHE